MTGGNSGVAVVSYFLIRFTQQLQIRFQVLDGLILRFTGTDHLHVEVAGFVTLHVFISHIHVCVFFGHTDRKRLLRLRQVPLGLFSYGLHRIRLRWQRGMHRSLLLRFSENIRVMELVGVKGRGPGELQPTVFTFERLLLELTHLMKKGLCRRLIAVHQALMPMIDLPGKRAATYHALEKPLWDQRQTGSELGRFCPGGQLRQGRGLRHVWLFDHYRLWCEKYFRRWGSRKSDRLKRTWAGHGKRGARRKWRCEMLF
ncbi:hypothetical protein EYF80_013511 [Liparis tanakae]|uniref:Uncharacterized protein n=1 Tax=Liparis tanakae TaxID=230148 RepID=A0A4Z2IGG1_9TELE|nr:hypothetical protein EYF80_013511 [Liparis tanakae]